MKLLVFLALFWSTSALAQENWQGFKPVKDTFIMANEYAYTSVVRIKTVGAIEKLTERPVQIVDVTITGLLSEKQLKSAGDPSKVEPNLRNIQIETCRRQGIRYCPIMARASSFTGYFDRGNILTTCRHPYHNWLIWASQVNGNRPIETISPPMVIYNASKETVYNSALVDTEAMLKFTLLNTNPALDFLIDKSWNKLSKSKANLLLKSDIVRLQSTQDIVKPYTLKYSTDYAAFFTEESLYLLGYPIKTALFKDGTGDSPGGNVLLVSSGNMVETYRGDVSVVTSNLTIEGMSGGPLTHGDGSVIGTNCYYIQPKKQKLAATRLMDVKAIKEMWADLAK